MQFSTGPTRLLRAITRARIFAAKDNRPDFACATTLVMASIADLRGLDVRVTATSRQPLAHCLLNVNSSVRGSARLASICIGLWLSLCVGVCKAQVSPQTLAVESCVPSNNTLIRAAGTDPVYLLHDGRKYYIQTRGWIVKNGYAREAVHILQPSSVAAIPSAYNLSEQSPFPGTPDALEGKLLLAHDSVDRVYVVKHGVRHWVLDSRWFTKNGYAGQALVPVTNAELQMLPLGVDFDYTPREHGVEILLLTLSLFAFFFISAGSYHKLRPTSTLGVPWSRAFQRWTTWRIRVLLLALFTAAIMARVPTAVSHPRFWAEEGTKWFQYASSHSLLKSLLFVCPCSSYYALNANLGAILASATAVTAGLRYAPIATTFLALFFQVLPIALILFGKSRLFDVMWKRVAGCLIVIFASSATDEIWLNSINSMSFLGLISLLLVFEETWTWPRWMRWALRGLLILCGLSSPYCCALIPLFILVAWRERKREQKIQCFILMFCALIQVGVVARTQMHLERISAISQPSSGIALASRGKDLRPAAEIVDVFSGQVALPALGYSGREDLLAEMGLKEAWMDASSNVPHPSSNTIQAAGWLCFVLLAAILWRLKGTAIYGMTNVLIGAFLLLATFTCVASLNGVPLGRYAFLPGLIFLLLLLANIDWSTSVAVRFVCAFVLSFGLANGIVDYRSHPWQEGPLWSEEVRIWKTDHAHPLRIWPPGWRFVYDPPLQH